MQTQRSTESEHYDRLPPVELAAATKPDGVDRRGSGRAAGFAVDVADATPAGSVEVRYGLDPVAKVWVASFFDGATGEFVKTVPATKVMHQLAELRAIYERSIDRRA